MFEELFEGPIARARQRESPLPEERRRFLSHLRALGYARSSLRAIACELIVIATRLDLSGSEPFDAAGVEAAARRWASVSSAAPPQYGSRALHTQLSVLGGTVAALSGALESGATGRGAAISRVARWLHRLDG